MTLPRDNRHVTGADLPHVRWRKSTHSNNGGSCVEAATLGRAYLVRDSKDPNGPVLALACSDWASFLDALKSDPLKHH
ncbi:DUF397 domain-containing protein [Actinomadura darangshiensis]|uniref:DUF397 domain-containing protein n=1 Tax=Actinomadura darangshiensis TaxID=705336 RepID=A0A4R5BAU8_9ACTN|nr:DUF397 domain-containing protein [Actinomadura darangshiensis]TDD80864.1 DUF397 domain-containing protein [Actinomadura darangshiensis]